MEEQERRDREETFFGTELHVHPKLAQVVESRKVWAGVIGLVTTLTLWGMGEIDGARAVEALTWVLGIFIGSVALEDGMARLFGTLAQALQKEELPSEELQREETKKR